MKQEKRILEIENEIETKRIDADNKFEALEDAKREVELDYCERIHLMQDNHLTEVERR